MKAIDLRGQRFGLLVAVELVVGLNRRAWRCVCDCGASAVVRTDDLRRSQQTSCGCRKTQLTVERSRKHGHAQRGKRAPEYTVWAGMLSRCTNPNCDRWEHYGGRGIMVCERWATSFAAFLEDMGPRPTRGHSIDRVNVNGNYEPSNCRWATSKEQRANRRGPWHYADRIPRDRNGMWTKRVSA